MSVEWNPSLVDELRHPRRRNERYYEPLCARAADELERLAAIAQSDAERIRKLEAECGRFENELFEARAADELERLTRENHILKLGAEAWPEILKDRDERLAALAQSDAETGHFYSDSEIAAFRQRAKENAERAMKLEANTRPHPRAVDLRALAQSNAEPVAWRWRYKYSENEEWSEWDVTRRKPVRDWKGSLRYQVEPLYTAPVLPTGTGNDRNL